MNVTTVKLSQLVPDPVINSRITGQGDGIKELAKSIDEHGLILPLSVRPIDSERFAIIDGHRRHAALKLLNGEEASEDQVNVAVLVRTDDNTAAREVSLAANIMRLPLHPADQFEAFKALVDEGVEVKDIASRFSLTVKDVKQRLALGNVIPPVLEFYRAGKFDLDAVKVFTSLSPERQESIFDSAVKARTFDAWHIRKAAAAEAHDASEPICKFVGRKAYEKAGGIIETDLFEGRDRWISGELLHKLAAELVEAKRQMLLDTGWSWVEMSSNLPDGWRWQWDVKSGQPTWDTPEKSNRYEQILKRRSEIETKDPDAEDDELQTEWHNLDNELEILLEEGDEAYTAEQKAQLGVVIDARTYELTYGVAKPSKDKSAAGEKGSEPKAKEKGEYSAALTDELNGHLTEAAQYYISGAPLSLAYNLMILTMIDADSYGKTAGLDYSARDQYRDSRFGKVVTATIKAYAPKKGKLADRIAHLDSLEKSERDSLFIVLVARSMVKQQPNTELVKYLASHKEPLDVRAVWHPDEDFFSRISKAQVMEAITEAKVALPPAGMKKDELAKFAAREIGKTDWMPKHLRLGTAAKQPKKKAA